MKQHVINYFYKVEKDVERIEAMYSTKLHLLFEFATKQYSVSMTENNFIVELVLDTM